MYLTTQTKTVLTSYYNYREYNNTVCILEYSMEVSTHFIQVR